MTERNSNQSLEDSIAVLLQEKDFMNNNLTYLASTNLSGKYSDCKIKYFIILCISS